MEVDPQTAETLRRESSALRLRSASVGAAPRPKQLFTSRAQSAAEAALDVRCACQFFQTTQLLPERVNPVGSRPSSSIGCFGHDAHGEQEDAIVAAEIEAVLAGRDQMGGSEFSFGPVLGEMDYYAESVSSRPNSPMHRPLGEHPPGQAQHHPGVGSSLELDPCLQPRPLHQKDLSTSILLQRRNSQTQLDCQTALGPSTLMPLQRQPSQRSFDIVVAPIRQRDPSTSSLVRKKMSNVPAPLQSDSQYCLENSFIPIQSQAHLSSSVSPIAQRYRGPYPGEAYPSDYEHMPESTPNTDQIDSEQPGDDFNVARSFGIGLVDLMALGTSLVQRRETRYANRSSEDLRGRSRSDRRQERNEQAAARKAEVREAKERAKREKEEDREIIRLAREEEMRKREVEKEAQRIYKEELARQKEAEKEADRIAQEEQLLNQEREKELQRLANEELAQQKQAELQNERLRKEEEKLKIESEKRQREEDKRSAKEEKLGEKTRKIAEQRQEKEAKKETERTAKELARRKSVESKESERLKKENAKELKKIAKDQARIQKETENKAKLLDECATESSEPLIYIRPSVTIKDVPETTKSISHTKPFIEPEEPVNYHEIIENTKVSVPVNTLVASLVHSNFGNKPPIRASTPSALPMTIDQSRDGPAIISNSMTQRDVSQSSLSRSRYSQERRENSHHEGSMDANDLEQPSYHRDPYQSVEKGSNANISSKSGPEFIRQRDQSQSSLIRRRYPTESAERSSNTNLSSKACPEFIRQRDPSQSSLLRRRYPTDASAHSSNTNLSSKQGPEFMRQRDPSQSSLLRKRYRQSSISPSANLDNVSAQLTIGEPADKISKNVSFEYEMETEEDHVSGIPAVSSISIAESSDKMRDHEYEPIGQPLDEPAGEETHEDPTHKEYSTQSIEQHFDDVSPEKNDTNDPIENELIDDSGTATPARRKSFMATANDRTRQMTQSLSNQAGALRTKIHHSFKKGHSHTEPAPHGSPKATERKKFLRSPDFPKLKAMKIHRPAFKRPEFKRPDFSKFKTPEFKINFPDRPKFKMPEALKRSKSTTANDDEAESAPVPRGSTSVDTSNPEDRPPKVPIKKGFSFGTYPRIFDRIRKPLKTTESTTTAATISRDNETEEDDESDRIRGPVQFGTFPKMAPKHNTIATESSSHWSGNASNLTDNDSGQYQRYSSEPDGIDRETSVERRMRLHLKNALRYEDDAEEDGESSFIEQEQRQTEEQRQLAEYDEENRVIHEISRQREGEFRQRKPLVHQESDLASEAENAGWAQSEVLRKQLEARSHEAASAGINKIGEYARSNESVQDDQGSTQETQSSGSSSHFRREGLLEDDAYVDHENKDDHNDFDRYISTAVREGLKYHPSNTPSRYSEERFVYDADEFDRSNEDVPFDDEKSPDRTKDFVDYRPYQQSSFESEEYEKSAPPSRPFRKQRVESHEADEEEIEPPVAAEYYPETRELTDEHTDENLDDRSFYDNDNLELQLSDAISSILTMDSRQFAPVVPMRKKKKRKSFEEGTVQQYIGRSVSSSHIHPAPVDETLVYCTEHQYPPSSSYSKPPTPLPRNRSRSRSQISPNVFHFADDADGKCVIDMSEAHGYAVVRKEPPPRPPVPSRHRGGSSQSLGLEPSAATLPRRATTADSSTVSALPERPGRNYSTLGPTRPSRRWSINSLTESPNFRRTPSVSRSDATQYEEIDHFEPRPDSRNLHSGNTLNKMKHRPLPAPPRPPRDRRSTSRRSTEPSDVDAPKLDRNGGAESLQDTSRISSLDMEEVEEVEVACQTDPLPDDFTCDSFEIDDTMRVLEPTPSAARGSSKTLEDILKQEQQAELERAHQFADEDSLLQGIQKFRDANQRSYSERSRGSDRPKTPVSQPMTPSAIVFERKRVLSTTETEASLIMRPFDRSNRMGRDEFVVQDSLEDDSDARLAEDTADTEDERIVHEALRRYRFLKEESQVDADSNSEIQRIYQSPLRIEETDIVEAQHHEEDAFTEARLEDVEHKIVNVAPQSRPADYLPEYEPPPQSPPRRRSLTTTDTMLGPTSTRVPDLESIVEPRTPAVPDPPLEMLANQNQSFHVRQLDVDNLSVSALHAGQILVSDLQSTVLNTQNLDCRSGNLVVKGIELPAGFLEELVDRVRDHAVIAPVTPDDAPTDRHRPESPPIRPPPPRRLAYPSDNLPYSVPPPSFYQLRDPSDDTLDILLPPQSPTAPRRRRHHYRHRAVGEEASSDEEYSRERRRSHHEATPRQTADAPPSIAHLSGQLISACASAIGRAGTQVVAAIRAAGHKDDVGNQQDVNVGLVILIVIVAVLMMIGMGGGPGRAVHTHHWDYFNPPENEGRM